MPGKWCTKLPWGLPPKLGKVVAKMSSAETQAELRFYRHLIREEGLRKELFKEISRDERKTNFRKGGDLRLRGSLQEKKERLIWVVIK